MNRHAASRAIRDDQGFVLPLVLGVLSVITVIAIGGYYMATQVNRESSVVESESRAFQAANAGVDKAIAILVANGYRAEDWETTMTIPVAELGSGSAAVRMVADEGGYEFRIVSEGTGTDGTRERVLVEFFYLNMYSFNISAAGNPTSGAALRGNSNIYGPFYARGSMDLTRANVSVEKGPLLVKNGDISLGGSSKIGTSADNKMGLVYCDGRIYGADAGSWFVSKLKRSCPLITLPAVDEEYLQARFDEARRESIDNVMGAVNPDDAEAGDYGDYPPNVEKRAGSGDEIEQYTQWSVGGNTGTCSTAPVTGGFTSSRYKCLASGNEPSPMGQGPLTLTIDGNTASFGKFAYDLTNPSIRPSTNPYQTYDDFAYDKATATLFVNGTVFIDGDLNITIPVKYKGNGIIVCNGDIQIHQFRPMSGLGPDSDGNPNQNFPTDEVVGLVSPTHVRLTGGGGNVEKVFTDPPEIAGAIFCPPKITLDNNLTFAGSIISSLIEAPLVGTNPHIRTSPNLPDVLSQSMPGRGQYLSTTAAWARQGR